MRTILSVAMTIALAVAGVMLLQYLGMDHPNSTFADPETVDEPSIGVPPIELGNEALEAAEGEASTDANAEAAVEAALTAPSNFSVPLRFQERLVDHLVSQGVSREDGERVVAVATEDLYKCNESSLNQNSDSARREYMGNCSRIVYEHAGITEFIRSRTEAGRRAEAGRRNGQE